MGMGPGEWYEQGQRPILKQGGPVTADIATSDLANLSVTSEKASAPLRTRSVTVVTRDPAKGVGLGTTCHSLWRPLERVEIRRLQLFPMTCWLAVTCGASVDIWTCTGVLGTFVATSTAVGQVGTIIDLGTLTNTCVAACQDLRMGYFSLNACDDAPAHLVQIDYLTSG